MKCVNNEYSVPNDYDIHSLQCSRFADCSCKHGGLGSDCANAQSDPSIPCLSKPEGTFAG